MRIEDANKIDLIGQYVVLNDREDAQVYKVVMRRSVQMVAVSYGNRRNASNWIDVRTIELASPAQVERYLADLQTA
jgi:hypothetical protein